MFNDAEVLFSQGRLGTPDHLYGLACECALKAVLHGFGIIRGKVPERPYLAHVDQLWGEYMIARQGRMGTLPEIPAANPFSLWRWTASDRYEPDATFTKARVDQHRLAAQEGMKALEAAVVLGTVLLP
jgi:hypothetical protein